MLFVPVSGFPHDIRWNSGPPSALAALNSPNETDRKTRAQNTGQAKSLRGKLMGRTLAAFVVAASLLTLARRRALSYLVSRWEA
jgi:hypothetical protein